MTIVYYCSASDPATEIAECINGFQSARDQISEQTESLLRRRQKSSTRLLGVKARELRLGADSESCLREMREKAYRISRNDRESSGEKQTCLVRVMVTPYTLITVVEKANQVHRKPLNTYRIW